MMKNRQKVRVGRGNSFIKAFLLSFSPYLPVNFEHGREIFFLQIFLFLYMPPGACHPPVRLQCTSPPADNDADKDTQVIELLNTKL